MLLWTCWRYREVQLRHRGSQRGQRLPAEKYPLRHLARFILIGLYTGTRASAIAAASANRQTGRAYVDLEHGVFYRLAQGATPTNKRQPPVPLPPRLLAHLRRWHEIGVAKEYFVEFHGKPVKSVKTAFTSAARLAKLPGRVTPHTLRHTAATWLMQVGVSAWEAAGFLGMSEKTLRDVYRHHHPEYLRTAARAIGKRKPLSLVKPLVGGAKRRPTLLNRLKILVGPGGLEPPTRPL
ncbi:MAG: tyrosine-type recombinase/integrase [Pseudolabrys sp.]|jgi:integrase